MKTLYIHVGMPRTATSTIQWFCCNNREKLKDLGYEYPEMPFTYEGKSAIRNGLFLTNKVLDQNGDRIIEEEEKIFRQGMELIGEHFKQVDNIILSDEGIWWGGYIRNPDVWGRLKSFSEEFHFTIKVLVYLRRQDEYLVSHWNQYVKHYTNALGNYHATLEECLEEYSYYMNLDYFDTLETISAEIGVENIIVRRFGEAVKSGIIHDFLECIGIKDYKMEDFCSNQLHKNSKLSENTVEIKRLVNEISDLTRKENRILEILLCNVSGLSNCDESFDMMGTETKVDFMKKYEENNRKLEEKYVHDDLDLFSSNYDSAKEWNKDNPYFWEDVIKFHTSTDLYLYRMMMEQKKDYKNSIKKLNKRIDQLEKKTNQMHYNMKHPIRAFLRMIYRRLHNHEK